jgi:predicted amidohydrolase
MPLVAALQMNSGENKARNLDAAVRLVRAARGRGVVLAGLPENFSWLGPEPERAANAETLDGPTLGRMQQLAREEGVALLAGSVLEQGAPGGRLYNTSVLFGPDGTRLAVYRKIHLFDVEVGDGVRYRESDAVAPGTELACADTPAGRLGLSICYDLRFPELYRGLADLGAELIAVPAAFTLMTGKDHWEVLLRARAIENQAWVMAPAQHGRHGEKRLTHGHALVADPWGLVVARASDGEGMAVADVDPAVTARIRRDLPSLQHRRLR